MTNEYAPAFRIKIVFIKREAVAAMRAFAPCHAALLHPALDAQQIIGIVTMLLKQAEAALKNMSHQLIANLPDNKPHLLFGDSRTRVMPRGDKACFLPRAAVHKMKAKTSRLGSSPQIRKKMQKALRTVLREVCRGASRPVRIAACEVDSKLK